MKKSIRIILSVILVIVICASTVLIIETINRKNYDEKLEKLGIFNSSVTDAMPQTVIHKLISDHFDSPLPEGKKVKKAILIGYDGFRADGLENVMDNEKSAVVYIKNQGGLYHTFSGGIKGINEQKTSTAPSWLAMLTGGWKEYNGISGNGQMKKEDVDTILTTLAKKGHSISFTTSWRQHTELSYRPDIVNSIKQGLMAEYTHQIDDTATYYQILNYVSKAPGQKKTQLEDPDMIFFTLEYADHAGHSKGFGNSDKDYVKGCKDADAYGYDIVKTIEERSTYEQEDWLILITTDHGGFLLNHGGQSPYERMTWLSCNKEINISDEYLNYEIK